MVNLFLCMIWCRDITVCILHMVSPFPQNHLTNHQSFLHRCHFFCSHTHSLGSHCLTGDKNDQDRALKIRALRNKSTKDLYLKRLGSRAVLQLFAWTFPLGRSPSLHPPHTSISAYQLNGGTRERMSKSIILCCMIFIACVSSLPDS